MNLKMETAINLAEIESGAGHNVMILVPDWSWSIGMPMTTDSTESRGAIYLRFANDHSGLKSVAIDTLILVASDTSTWDAKGEEYARERLRTSLDPRVIKVGEGDALDVCFDCGKHRNPYSSEQFRWVSVHSHAELCCMKCFPQHRERWIT